MPPASTFCCLSWLQAGHVARETRTTKDSQYIFSTPGTGERGQTLISNKSSITQYLQACLLMGDPGDDPGDYGVDEAPAIFPPPAAGHFDVSGIAETWTRPAEVVFPRTLNPF